MPAAPILKPLPQ